MKNNIRKFPPEFGNEDDLIRRGDVMKAYMLIYEPKNGLATNNSFEVSNYKVNLFHILNASAVIKSEDFKDMISKHLNK